jgi:hypothetical protein
MTSQIASPVLPTIGYCHLGGFPDKFGLENMKGIELSPPRKSDVMTHLKQVMEQKRLRIPRDRELIIEMNAEIAKLTEAGKTKFSHRSGTHDDRLWALVSTDQDTKRHRTIRSSPSDISASIHGTDQRSSIHSQAPLTLSNKRQSVGHAENHQRQTTNNTTGNEHPWNRVLPLPINLASHILMKP